MAGKSIEAGKAFLRLLIDDKQFAKGLEGSLAKLDSLGNSAIRVGARLGAVGAAMSAPFVAGIKIFSSVGSELADMSERTGLSARRLSELKFAAQQTGTSLQGVETAVRSMARNLSNAESGAGSAASAINRLGLDITQLTRQSPEQQFNAITTALAGVADPTKRAALAMQIFGKSGTALIPMLANLESLSTLANRLGLVMDDPTATSADELDDAFNRLKLQSEALASAIGAAVAPAVSAAASAFSQANTQLIQFVKNNTGLVQIGGGVALAVSAIASALVSLGGAAKGATIAIKLLKSALDLIGKNPWVVAITLAITAVTAIAAKFLYFQDTVDGASEATDEHAASQKKVADAMEAGTLAIDKRAEAMKRLSEADREAVGRADALEKETNTESTAGELRKKAGLQRQREEIDRIEKQIAAVSEEISSGKTLGGMNIPVAALKKELQELRRELVFLTGVGGNVLFSDRQGGGGAGGAGFGALPIGIGLGQAGQNAQLQNMVTTLLQSSIQAAFSPVGFAGGGSNISTDVFSLFQKKAAEQVSGRGTFSGRLSSQILGGSDPAARDRKEQIKLAKETRDYNRTIARKTFLARSGSS